MIGTVCKGSVATFCILMLASGSAVADEGTVDGGLRYESSEAEVTDFALDTGVAVESDEIEGGERVKAILMAAPLDREAFLAAIAETGSPALAMFRLRIDRRVEFDVCRYDDGTPTEICGVFVSGPDIDSNHSGLGGFYEHFTESVRFADGRVAARLVTNEPEDGTFDSTFTFDVTFDLPITPPDEE